MARKKRIIRNGYVTVIDDDLLSTADFDQYEYEHRIVAEEMLGRPLRSNEDVHHLDLNRENNSPDNLLVLEKTQHAKLHSWLEKNIIIPTAEYSERVARGCVRCIVCERPIDPGQIYCSKEHSDFGRRVVDRPNPDVLAEELKHNSYVQLGKKYGVSDKTIRKWNKQTVSSS